MKNKHILQYCRWVVYGTERQEFCVFDYIDRATVELLFFNSLFQNNYFNKHFAENKVKIQAPVFVASLTEPLSLCVFDYYRI